MIPLRLRGVSRAVLGGFLIGSSLIGHAQENDRPGMVRITDSRPRGVPIRNAGHAVGKGEYHKISSGSYGGYGYGYGDCPDCYDDCDDGRHCRHKHWFREHYCKHSPDHGYASPGKIPIYRQGVQYNSYFPVGWYGTANGNMTGPVYPTIYQPTDTTQLGFYYQHVPFWQPNPNALPPRPIPAQWHRKIPAGQVPWNLHGWGHGYGGAYCPPGAGWVDTTNSPTPMQNQPAPAANPPAGQSAPKEVPAPPADDSALNLHIRRASLEQ
jgi:hypothetical protein